MQEDILSDLRQNGGIKATLEGVIKEEVRGFIDAEKIVIDASDVVEAVYRSY